jgi:hypothetical protein
MSNHPIVPPILALLALFGATWGAMRLWDEERIWRVARPVTLLCLGLAGAVFVVIVLQWLAYPGFADHAESSVASIAYLVETGRPLYHGANDGPVYNNNYGPSFYYMIAALYALLGASIATTKLYGLTCLVVTLVAFGMTVKHYSDWRWTLVAVLGLTAALMRFEHISFWVRPDPFVMMMAALALLAGVSGNRAPRFTAIIIGALAALAFSSKVHGMLYLMPAVFLHPFGPHLHRRFAWFLLPFLAVIALAFAPNNVSIFNYLPWIRLTTHHELQGYLFVRIVEEILWMALPVAIALLARRRSGRFSAPEAKTTVVLACTTVVAMLVVAVPAAKSGAGAHHMLPFALPLVLCFVMLLRAGLADNPQRTVFRAVAVAAGIAFSAVGIAKGTAFARGLDDAAAIRGAIAEIEQLHARFSDHSVVMAYGDSCYSRTWLRVLLVYAGEPYDFDAPAVAELQMAGAPLPTASIDRLRSGNVGVYLVPAGTAPFRMESPYSRDGTIGMGGERQLLFSPEFLQAFDSNYDLAYRGRYFDAWQFRGQGSATTTRQ